MNPTMMGLVLEVAAFFELSSDDVINPDVAVAQLEDIVANLRKLPPQDRAEFAAYVRQRAEREPAEDRREFFRAFPEEIEG